jgi:hypothetical protein
MTDFIVTGSLRLASVEPLSTFDLDQKYDSFLLRLPVKSAVML